MPAPAIAAENLTKRYGDALAADGLSFTVPYGKTLGLLGGNGARKTTTSPCCSASCSPPRAASECSAMAWRPTATPPSPA